jgi:hypothetical protein
VIDGCWVAADTVCSVVPSLLQHGTYVSGRVTYSAHDAAEARDADTFRIACEEAAHLAANESGAAHVDHRQETGAGAVSPLW